MAATFLLVATALVAIPASATSTMPGQTNCDTGTASNPRPSAWYSLGKPASYFDDGCFHQFMVNNPDTASIDVLIIPPVSALALRDANLLRASVQMWESGLKKGAEEYGMNWLRDGLSIRPFVLGEDIPAGPSALVPDIVVVMADQGPTAIAWAYAGIGIDAPLTFCHPLMASAQASDYPSAEVLRAQPGFDGHDGGGWGNVNLACGDTGSRTCFVVGAVLYDGLSNMQAINFYDLMSHEFGHCLGLGHVGDASDFASLAYPPDDIMSYEQDGREPAYALCVSNLNVKTAAYIYHSLIPGASALGYSADSLGYIKMQDGANPINSGNTAVQSPLPSSSWRIIKSDGTLSTTVTDCPDPNLALIQLPPLPPIEASPAAAGAPALAQGGSPATHGASAPGLIVLLLAGLAAVALRRRA